MGTSRTVMVFGLGEVGAWVMHLLARQEGVSTIIGCARREDYGTLLADFVAASAGIAGYSKTIKFERCDVGDTDAAAELINRYDPDLIFGGMTLLGWQWTRKIPPEMNAQVVKMLGSLVPGQLYTTRKLMQAVKKSHSTWLACSRELAPAIRSSLTSRS